MLAGTHGPVPVLVSRGNRSVSAWAWEFTAWDAEIRSHWVPDDPDPADHVAINRLLAGQLDDAVGETLQIAIPPIMEYMMVDPVVDDLPDDTEIQVCPDDYPHPESPSPVVVLRNGIAVCVAVVPRDHVRAGTVRVPQHLQILTGSGSGDALRVVTPVTSGLDFSTTRSPRNRLTAITASLGRAAGRVLERTLRWAFGAPELVVRVGLPHPGDDNNKTIALHPAALQRIGAESGDQVILRWGSVERVLTAVADHAPPTGGSDQPANGSADRLRPLLPPFPEAMPAHLAARVPAASRYEMGIPVAAVVTVRRSTSSVLMSNLYRLIIPIAGLSLAGAALEDPNWLLLGLGALVLSILALTRLRIPGRRAFSTQKVGR
jgi:hypothetical protein